jgi:sugar/nucleoside kinase (ribokinase family)
VDLVTVGDAFEDLVFVGLPRLPRAGEELKTPTLVRTIGGGAVITAIAAARLGVSSAVVTAVGASGEQRLREEGVKLIILRRPGEPAAVSAAL